MVVAAGITLLGTDSQHAYESGEENLHGLASFAYRHQGRSLTPSLEVRRRDGTRALTLFLEARLLISSARKTSRGGGVKLLPRALDSGNAPPGSRHLTRRVGTVMRR